MSQPNQAYCVWWDSGDGTKDAPGLETRLLHAIMEECRAKDVGYKADVQAVFVHVGALKTINMLNALPERRAKRAELCFYTYGTHETVPREYWGIHGIFPIGASFYCSFFSVLGLTCCRWSCHFHAQCLHRRSDRCHAANKPDRQTSAMDLLYHTTSFRNARKNDRK